jgi:hypothetical protein
MDLKAFFRIAFMATWEGSALKEWTGVFFIGWVPPSSIGQFVRQLALKGLNIQWEAALE